MELLIKISTNVTIIVVALFALHSLYRWVFPIKVNAGCTLVFDSSNSGEIWVDVTNTSKEAQYIKTCIARTTYPVGLILKRYFMNPFIHPRWINVIRFTAQGFSFVNEDSPKKIEPLEVVNLKYKLHFDKPLHMFLGPKFLVEIQLSSGRIVRSQSLNVPEAWKFIPKNKKVNDNKA